MKQQYPDTGLEVAIVGLAGQFPDANDIDAFWENLRSGKECIRFFDKEALIRAGAPAVKVRETNFVPAKGVVQGTLEFDAEFFGYSAREAAMMDPQLRRFHQLAWHALEDAGYAPDAMECNVGLYAGAGDNSLWISRFLDNMSNSFAEKYEVFTLNGREFFCTRVAYKLNLKGPAVTVQTACSTSLVAVHCAITALLSGECDMAMAGAVAIHANDLNGRSDLGGYGYQEGMILSPDGHCRPFDASAQGTVPGDGMGMVVLKRLDDARRDGDSIHGVIKGSAINNDGHMKAGFTAPSVEGQSRVIRSALRAADVEPQTVSYIEAHGTGTPLGDPIEIEALGKVFGLQQSGACRIGSVKSNIGHLDAAAGMAGLIKTVLALKHNQLPASLHYEQANPKANLAAAGFTVNDKLAPWEDDRFPLRAGVSSFGIGGTNAHVILEEYVAPDDNEDLPGWKLLPWSAKSEESLDTWQGHLAERLASDPSLSLSDSAFTLAVGRSHFDYRRFLVTDSAGHALEALRTEGSPLVLSGRPAKQCPKITFMFPGQGSQHLAMGSRAYQQIAEYRLEVDRCLSLLDPQTAKSVRGVLGLAASGNEPVPDVNSTHLAQPALFIVEYALAKTFISWGIVPDSMIGHSIGEYVAACIAGVFSLEDALRMVVHRGAVMAEAEAGAMLGVNLDRDAIRPYLSEEVALAALNSSSLSVVSGRVAAIDALQSELSAKGIPASRLKVSHGYHSHLMEPVLARFSPILDTVTFGEPNIPYYSNVSGRLATHEQIDSPEYWRQHLLGTVDVSTAIADALGDNDRIFLELGPGRSLATFVRKHEKYRNTQLLLNALPQANEETDDACQLLNAVGRLYVAGAAIDWRAFYRHERRCKVQLPGYAFLATEFMPQPVVAAKASNNDVALQDQEVRLYQPVWSRKRIDGSHEQPAITPINYLVFRDEAGLLDALSEQLEDEGHRVIRVTRGNGFGRRSNGVYHLDSASARDFALLLDELRRAQIDIHAIVHGWAIDDGSTKSTSEMVDDCFYSLMHLAQALAERTADQPVLLTLVATQLFSVNGDEAIVPAKATLMGALRVIPQELPGVRTRVIETGEPWAGEGRIARYVHMLRNELRCPHAPQIVSYRGTARWCREYRPIAPFGDSAPATGIALKAGGTYLITGGIGGIGLTLAKHMAGQFPINLILTTRRDFPDPGEYQDWLVRHPNDPTSRSIETILLLEQSGSHVDVLKADVASADDMYTVSGHIERKFGRLDGIVHCAGVSGGGAIVRKDNAATEKVLVPKIRGCEVLSQIFSSRDLDFVVLCSSITAILGGFGQFDYCSANAYMDAFAQRAFFGDRTAVVSINWDTWSEVGMAASNRAASLPSEAELLGQVITLEDDKIIFKQTLSANGSWALREHWIFGKATLPGSYYIDVVSLALARASRGGALTFSNVVFLSPLLVDESNVAEITVSLTGRENGFDFVVDSGQLQHAKGFVSNHPASITPIASAVDIEQLQSVCSERIIDNPDEIAHLGKITAKVDGERQSGLVEFGPRWQNIRQIRLGAQNGLALMQLPEACAADVEVHRLHPALLDVATAYLRPFHREGIFLPFSYGRLVSYRPIPSTFYSYARLLATQSASERGILTFDIDFYTVDGTPIAKIEHFALREVDQKSIEASVQGGIRAQKMRRESSLVSSGLSNTQALWAFDQTLALAEPSVAVAYGDIDTRISEYDEFLNRQERKDTTKSSRPDLGNAYVKPKSENERAIAAIWEDLLAIEAVGMHDNFFELGGDSLLLVQLHKQLQNHLSSRLSITDLYDYPTVAKLTQALGESRETKTQQSAEITMQRAQQQIEARARRQVRRRG